MSLWHCVPTELSYFHPISASQGSDDPWNPVINTGVKRVWNITETAFALSSVQSCLTLCNPLDCSLPGSSVHGIFLGKNTRVSCHFLLQGIFPTQGSNPCLLHLLHWHFIHFTQWVTLYPLSYLGSLRLPWKAYINLLMVIAIHFKLTTTATALKTLFCYYLLPILCHNLYFFHTVL